MDLALGGKRILITGSTRGLGEAMARLLAAEGAKVIIHGRNAAAANKVAASIGGPDRVAVVLGELADSEAIDKVAAGALAAFGGVDVLVNNAGLFGADSWDAVNVAEWTALYAANVVAPARLSSLMAADMKPRGWGRLIHIGSVAAAVSLPFCPNYAATKAALACVSSTLAKHYGKFGVTSNILGVGTIANMAEYAGPEFSGPDPAYALMTAGPDGHYNQNTLSRSGTPEEVAYTVAMLASPNSAFINGSLVRVDGGCVPTPGL